MAEPLNTVVLSVESEHAMARRARAAFAGERQAPRISFASVDLLWRTLTAKRWAVLRAMAGAGPLSIREVARRVGRDVKAVHGDIQALIAAGLVDREPGGVVFPYDAIHVDLMLTAA